jgi:hypothetical protein
MTVPLSPDNAAQRSATLLRKRDLWGNVFRTVDGLVVTLGGKLFDGDESHPLAEAREALDQLFDEVAPQLKAHMELLPNFADYFL